MNYMWRTFRVLLGSLFYLLASLVLIISLKCYPKDVRQQAKDNFLQTQVLYYKSGKNLY